jgi:L-threonylcarbamoyladenylate synthase
VIRKYSTKVREEAIDLLRHGQVVAFPTETVYGLGALAYNVEGIDRIFAIKGRPSTNPLIVHVPDVDSIKAIADLTNATTRHYFDRLVPLLCGPLTVVLPRLNGLPNMINSNSPTIAVRIPSHEIALDLLRHLEAPIAAPSANRSNRISPTTAQHVYDEFGDTVPLIIDGGPCKEGLESTVLSLLNTTPQILRPGVILKQEIEEALGITLSPTLPETDGNIISPGQGSLHYAPSRTKLYLASTYLNEKQPNNNLSKDKLALIALFASHLSQFNLNEFNTIEVISHNNSTKEVAENLFSVLRKFDQNCYDAVIVSELEPQGLGLAIMDRLKRATSG